MEFWCTFFFENTVFVGHDFGWLQVTVNNITFAIDIMKRFCCKSLDWLLLPFELELWIVMCFIR